MMKISEIMTPTVLVLDDNASLTEAAQKMQKLDVGLLVATSKDSISGLLTDRDIVIRGIAEKKDLTKRKCGISCRRIRSPAIRKTVSRNSHNSSPVTRSGE